MIKRLVREVPAEPRGRTIGVLVGGRLRTRRTHLGLAIDSVAEELGIEPSACEGYETGAEEAPALLLSEIAELFGVSLHWIFQDIVALEEEDGQTAGCRDLPRAYRVATAEERVHFLADSFRKLDHEGQQHLLAIAAALSQPNRKIARK